MLKPHSLLAQVGRLDTDTKKGYGVEMRLLAFAMGVSAADELTSQDAFELEFIPMCKALLPHDCPCTDFARTNASVENAVTRSSPDQIQAACTERTHKVKKHKYRKEFQETEVAVL